MINISALIPLILAGGYTLLLMYPIAKKSTQAKQISWLLAVLILSIGWEFLLFLSSSIAVINLSIKVLLLTTVFLGMSTAVFANWSRQQLWFLSGLTAVLLTVLIDIFFPLQVISLPRINADIKVTNLISHIVWFVLSGYILIGAWISYSKTTFSWHANRLLFWLLAILLIFIGESLTFFHWTGLTITGQIARLVGILSLVYGVSSHKLFDVRTRSQKVLSFAVITFVTSLPLAILILLSLAWSSPGNRFFISIGVMTFSFLVYQPFRRLVTRIYYHFVVDERFDTAQVLRTYSQRVYETLDVQQLALVNVSTIQNIFKSTKSTLMTVTETHSGVEIAPIPVMGHESGPRILLPKDSILINALSQQHTPLTQYDVDFNPEYLELENESRDWLNEMAMDVYVPVGTDTELAGIIAVGPKETGVPYQPGELELVQILADQTVIALQNARLYSELGAQNDKIRHLNVDLVQQNERLEIMDRVKSDFITIASHELRTPLTQVKGYADILDAFNEEDSLTKKQTREIVGHINRATWRLESLITAMLDASQLDAAGIQLQFVQTTLDTIIRMALDPLNQAIIDRNISFKIRDVNKLPNFYADFKRLVQAMNNIIGNAIKYTPDHGSIVIDAQLAPTLQANEEFIEITVTDTGIGIDPQYHDLIFEKFFRVGDPQLHSTGTTKFKGAGPGLGLPIAKGVIEAHGGRIWVESEGEDEKRLPGSRFHIILPVHPPGFDEKQLTDESPEEFAELIG